MHCDWAGLPMSLVVAGFELGIPVRLWNTGTVVGGLVGDKFCLSPPRLGMKTATSRKLEGSVTMVI